MASDRQSRLQQLLLDSIESQNRQAAESGRSRSIINDMSYAVAKALRNDLTVVSGNAELISMRQVSDAVQRFAGNAQVAAESATRVIERLSLLDSIGKGERSAVDVQHELACLRTQLECRLPTNIHIEWNLQPSKIPLNANAEELRIIVLELMQNSMEAMPAGGSISIRNGEVRLCAQPRQKPEWWLSIEIHDTGIGMSEAQSTLALAPVTKINGVAQLALGLCLLDRFVTELSGILEISSLEGEGTELTILLPLATKSQVSDSGIGAI